jgi:ribosomal protein L29
MAMKRSDIEALSPKDREAKIAELELAMLELRGEGRADKARALKKTIAKLKTPSSKRVKK